MPATGVTLSRHPVCRTNGAPAAGAPAAGIVLAARHPGSPQAGTHAFESWMIRDTHPSGRLFDVQRPKRFCTAKKKAVVRHFDGTTLRNDSGFCLT